MFLNGLNYYQFTPTSSHLHANRHGTVPADMWYFELADMWYIELADMWFFELADMWFIELAGMRFFPVPAFRQIGLSPEAGDPLPSSPYLRRAHTGGLAKMAFRCSGDPARAGWFIKLWFAAFIFVVKIATYAKSETAIENLKKIKRGRNERFN
jgi:hypothetical protein